MGEIFAFHKKDELALTAKSVILNEPFNKIVNISLANVLSDKPRECFCRATLQTESKCNKYNRIKTEANFTEKKQLIMDSNVVKITMKYFKLWQTKVKEKRKDRDRIHKIENFLNQLRKQKQIRTLNSKSKNESNNKNHSTSDLRGKNISQIYKSRHKAQQSLIKAQKVKLQEQEKVIESLKMGIIVDEAQKCLENSKCEIRDVFKRCSQKVKCKIIPLEAVQTDTNIIAIETSKVPKILCQMEKRAMERAIRRNIILERKRLMEEKKRKEIETAIANKKTADEEQRQRNLDAMQEQRKIEAELERRRQENKKKYLNNINRANKLYKKKIMYKYFNCFKILIKMKAESQVKSETFYKSLIEKKCVNDWRIYVKEKIEREHFEANCLYNYKLMSKTWKAWHSVLVVQKQSMQVAEDLYDMKMQSKVFIYWHSYVCKQQMIEVKNYGTAEKHYNSRILLHHFYLWKSLPAVIQLEKAKEQKKRIWREKVWEILPDYEPYVEVT